MRCIEAVEAAVKLPFEQGLALERKFFIELVQSNESKALRHVFFAERAASKIPDVPDDTRTRAINTAGVIGFGTMGGGIAMSFANAGIPVTVFEKDQAALDRGLAMCRRNWEATAKKGRLTMDQVEQRMALLTPTLDFNALASADIVIEAAYEDMAVKQDVFKRLDAVSKRGAILATNTSTLDVDQIAAATARPQDVIGTHFFSPANVMRLLEDRAWKKDEQRCARDRDAAREAAEESRRRVWRVRRFHRQSHARAVSSPIDVSGRRRRLATAGRRGDGSIWNGDGAVCGRRSGRARHRLRDSSAPLR